MIEFPLLSIMTFLPLVGIVIILSIRGGDDAIARNARHMALYTSVFNLVFGVYMFSRFDTSDADFQFVERYDWLSSIGMSYYLGLDGISLFFVFLSVLLTPICILASWTAITSRVREYMVAFLLLQMFMIGTFVALDGVLFYIFFEGVLIPMFLIIGIWGGDNRIYASYKFFLYTLLGSVLMLVALLGIYAHAGTTDIAVLIHQPVVSNLQYWFWIAFFASFAVKMPMWPVHTWLPDAHVQAPTAGSVILAGVLLKMGGYGFLRFSIPMMPEASAYFAPYVFGLSVVAIIYTSLVALVQTDIKKLIAYSSVAHMGYVTLGIFSATYQGIEGAMFQMISHGLISGALFLCIGVLYERLHTRDIERFGGIVKNMPKFATILLILTMASAGLPGTSGFVGEFLTLLGVYQVSSVTAVMAMTGVILGAAYMLRFYRKVAFGPQVNADAAAMPDLNAREYMMLVPLVVMVLLIGVFPQIVTEPMKPSIQVMVMNYEKYFDEVALAQNDEDLRLTVNMHAATDNKEIR